MPGEELVRETHTVNEGGLGFKCRLALLGGSVRTVMLLITPDPHFPCTRPQTGTL